MRKSMILFALLLAAGIGGMCCAHSTLTAAQDNVSFTVAEEYGDVTAADSLTVSVRAHLDYHLLWETEHTFGQTPRTHTDFSFHSSQLRWIPEFVSPPLSLFLPTDINHSSSGINLLDENEGIGLYYPSPIISTAMLREIAARTQNGQQHTETINLRDYYDYYPISAQVRAGLQSEEYYYYAIQEDEQYLYVMPDEAEVSKAFTDFFRIPVPEGRTVEVTIRKDSAGNVVQIATSQEDAIYIDATGVETEDGVYFVVSASGGPAGFRGIPGGFGVYLLPRATILDGQGTEYPTLDYWNLKTVFPLGVSTTVPETKTAAQLTLSEDGRCLNLITFEDGVYFLTVIELGSMTEKQKIPLFEGGEGLFFMANYVDGLLFAALGDNRFVLAERRADNTYRQVLTGARDFLLSFEDYIDWAHPQIAWNGERLALVSWYRRRSPVNAYGHGLITDTCGFTLEIYDESGLTYKGAFESSLDVLSLVNIRYDVCRLIGEGALSVWW